MFDATNETTTTANDVQTVYTWTVTETISLDDIEDEGDPPYLTFMDGWRFRVDHWHMHPWFGEMVTDLMPIPVRPRRTEETGRKRRWTSGFL